MTSRLRALAETETQPKRPQPRGETPRVKIIWFTDGERTTLAEREIEAMLAIGWRIVAAGGGGDAPQSAEGQQNTFGLGFIVLQKDP